MSPKARLPLSNLLRAAIVLAVGMACVWLFTWALGFGGRISNESAQQTFLAVTGMKPPAGSTQLRAVRRQGFIKSWCWITLKGTPAGIGQLLRRAKPLEPEKRAALVWPKSLSVLPRFDARDQQAVEWRGVSVLKEPRFYEISNYFDGSFWHGYMIVEADSGRIFIHAAGD